MKRLGKQCPACRAKDEAARAVYGPMLRYTMKMVKPGVFECTRCGHRERKVIHARM